MIVWRFLHCFWWDAKVTCTFHSTICKCHLRWKLTVRPIQFLIAVVILSQYNFVFLQSSLLARGRRMHCEGARCTAQRCTLLRCILQKRKRTKVEGVSSEGARSVATCLGNTLIKLFSRVIVWGFLRWLLQDFLWLLRRIFVSGCFFPAPGCYCYCHRDAILFGGAHALHGRKVYLTGLQHWCIYFH